MKIEDLDVLRPEPRYVRIGGKDIDVSFIPCGITFEVDCIVQELSTMDPAVLAKNGPETHRAFDLSVDLCAAFCSHRHPELNREWFLDNADANQVRVFAGAVKDALSRAYSGAGEAPKNRKAARGKSPSST